MSSSLTISPQPSVSSVPIPRRRSSASDFLPPMRRVSTDSTRPVPFAAKFQRVHPGTTGVTVLKHLERLDAVEASLSMLGPQDSVPEEEEVDVGEAAGIAINTPSVNGDATKAQPSPFSPPGSPLATVHEVASSAASIAEEDLAAMSKSTSHVESSSSSNFRWSSHNRPSDRIQQVDWLPGEEAQPPKRTVIVEVGIPILFCFHVG